jgi:hypothetical protein
LPATLKERLLAQLEPEPGLPAVLTPQPADTPPAGLHPRASATGNWVWPWQARRRTQWGWRLAAAAALLLFVLTLAWSIQLNRALARERALRIEFMDLVGQQQELVLEVVDSNQTTRRVLLPPGGESRAYGKLFTREGLPHVVAMAARLPQPPPNQSYHLWVTEAGETSLAGELTINQAGFGLLLFDDDSDNPSYEAAQLTLQSPGSNRPAGEVILVWPTE